MVLISGVIGTLLSVWLYYNFCGWLNILNCTLPPVGIILVISYFMNKKAYESLDPAYQKALNQAVSEALKELAPKLGEIDKQNKETLEKKGMTIIKYDKSFYDQVLALDSVKALYKDINSQINGIGDVLMQELDAAAKK